MLSLQPRSAAAAARRATTSCASSRARSQERGAEGFPMDEVAVRSTRSTYTESMNTVLAQECMRYNKLIKTSQLDRSPTLLKALKGLVVMSARARGDADVALPTRCRRDGARSKGVPVAQAARRVDRATCARASRSCRGGSTTARRRRTGSPASSSRRPSSPGRCRTLRASTRCRSTPSRSTSSCWRRRWEAIAAKPARRRVHPRPLPRGRARGTPRAAADGGAAEGALRPVPRRSTSTRRPQRTRRRPRASTRARVYKTTRARARCRRRATRPTSCSTSSCRRRRRARAPSRSTARPSRRTGSRGASRSSAR